LHILNFNANQEIGFPIRARAALMLRTTAGYCRLLQVSPTILTAFAKPIDNFKKFRP